MRDLGNRCAAKEVLEEFKKKTVQEGKSFKKKNEAKAPSYRLLNEIEKEMQIENTQHNNT